MKRLAEEVENSSHAAVAVALKCTVTTVYNLLSGGRPSLKIALAAEDKYGIDPHSWEAVIVTNKKEASR